MPSEKRKGWVGRYIELPDGLDRELKAFVESHGGRWAEHVRMAIRRHLAYPPPEAPPLAPLPDSPGKAARKPRK